MLLLELLQGDEFTIDCFTLNGNLSYIGIRKRELYKNGLSIITKMINENSNEYNIIRDIAYKINNTICFKGAWFFQLKYDKHNKLKLLEVSTRIAGASSINRLNGCNLIYLSIMSHYHENIQININNIHNTIFKIHKNKVDESIFDKYENLFIDLDDTIISNDKINISAIALIYKFRNLLKNVFLITRHIDDPINTLNRLNISTNLFNGGIIHITNINDKKCNYIKNFSIFIDDSFKERNFKNDTILKLDVDCIDFFI
jgi:hypothetical protein